MPFHAACGKTNFLRKSHKHSILYVTLLLVIAPRAINAFYLPGIAPHDYQDGEEIELKVNKLTSTHTQLPFEYKETPGLCQAKNVVLVGENLGEVLSGDMIETSPYKLKMRDPFFCKTLCQSILHPSDIKLLSQRIKDKYRINMIMDNLPAATKYYTGALEGDDEDPQHPGFVAHYEKGFALGFTKEDRDTQHQARFVTDDKIYINNHLKITVLYHPVEEATDDQDAKFRIVGFEVEPYSVEHQELDNHNTEDPDQTRLSTCESGVAESPQPQALNVGIDAKETQKIYFSYEVKFEYSAIRWASRWDMYLKMTDSQIHWFSIINSLMICLFLTGMVAMIMTKTLHKDFRRYNQIDEDDTEAQQEETGWKLVHGDVFRPPRHGGLFATLVGTGFQVYAMTLLTMIFAVLGFLSPANRGGLMTALLFLFVFMGIFAGYAASRTYKMFGLSEWPKITLWTALLFPGINFTIFFILNLFVWGEKSSGAVPFGTMFALLVLWFGISVPLVYLGAYFGFKKDEIKAPVKVNLIPRQIPEQAWYMQSHFSILVGGVLPFGAVFIEIFFIMSGLWLDRFYYMFGFLFIVFVIVVVTCAEITIVMCYFQLCSEDYEWWWRSYLTSGSSALYLFLYSVLYFFTKLEIVKFVSGLLFFGYMFLISLAFFVLTGTIGFVATLLFVRKIYSSIKID